MDLPYKILRMFLYGKIHYIIANPILVGMAMGYNPQEFVENTSEIPWVHC